MYPCREYNLDSLVARVDNFYWRMKSWPNHLFYFTAPTLQACLAAAEFAPVEVFTHQGESDPWDDRRVIRDRLQLDQEEHITAAMDLLCRAGRAQELVVIARRAG